jgi:glycosyltransferase involved in cell wall biosynthesis
MFMKMYKNLTIVVPCKNESNIIGTTLSLITALVEVLSQFYKNKYKKLIKTLIKHQGFLFVYYSKTN